MLVDYNGNVPTTPNTGTIMKKTDEGSGTTTVSVDEGATRPNQKKDKDDVFSDSEADETVSSKSRQAQATSAGGGTVTNNTISSSETKTKSDQIASLSRATEHLSMGNTVHVDGLSKSDAIGGAVSVLEVLPNTQSEFKVMAADASVFTFGDDEDYESE